MKTFLFTGLSQINVDDYIKPGDIKNKEKLPRKKPHLYSEVRL